MLSTDVFDVLNGIETPEHRQESGTYHQKFHPSMVYHEHVRPDHRFPEDISRTQMVLATTNPTVIPIRDPLLSLISYQNRAVIHSKVGSRDFLPTKDVLDRWVLLANQFHILRQFDQVQFLCWDLLGENSKDRLWEVSRGIGLLDIKPATLGVIANNSTGDYPLKDAYAARDVDQMRWGVYQDGFQRLVSREKILRPFLECLGYSDLMWWS